VGRLVLDSVVPSWNVDPLQLVNMRQTATDRATAAGNGFIQTCLYWPPTPAPATAAAPRAELARFLG